MPIGSIAAPHCRALSSISAATGAARAAFQQHQFKLFYLFIYLFLRFINLSIFIVIPRRRPIIAAIRARADCAAATATNLICIYSAASSLSFLSALIIAATSTHQRSLPIRSSIGIALLSFHHSLHSTHSIGPQHSAPAAHRLRARAAIITISIIHIKLYIYYLRPRSAASRRLFIASSSIYLFHLLLSPAVGLPAPAFIVVVSCIIAATATTTNLASQPYRGNNRQHQQS